MIVVVILFQINLLVLFFSRQFYGYLSFKRFITVLWISFPSSRRKSKEIDGSCNEFPIISNVETFINHLDDSRNLSLLSRLDFCLLLFPSSPILHTYVPSSMHQLFFSFILFRSAKYQLFIPNILRFFNSIFGSIWWNKIMDARNKEEMYSDRKREGGSVEDSTLGGYRLSELRTNSMEFLLE